MSTAVSAPSAAKQKPFALPSSRFCPLCSSKEVSSLLVAPDRFHWRREKYTLTRCASCSAVWQADPPAPNEMGPHYSEDYHKVIAWAGETAVGNRWRTQRQRISQFKQGGAILDVGCSSGGFLSTLDKRAWQLYGIEMEPSTAERARKLSGAQVFVGDVLEATFAPNTFDVITCFDLLEHIYTPVEFLAKVLQWLKPGGIFYTVLPNIDSWEARFFRTYWYGLELPRHLFHFSPRSLRALTSGLGFEQIYLATPAISYVERSMGYVCSGLLESLGFSPTPQAKQKPSNVAWKIIRKGFRLSIVRPLAHAASLASAGPSMEGVFGKPAHGAKQAS
jgi:SAM-dependent methyltransferase